MNKLEKYFKTEYIQSNDEWSHKRCFVYDPYKQEAIFVERQDETDTFIISRCGLRCYVRYSSRDGRHIPRLPVVDSGVQFVPLLKSNLQKAVRRMDAKVATTTCLALLQINTTELFRRLPIICIEDVCPIDAFPILVWFMITDKEYKLCEIDKYNILQIVNNLCNITQYGKYDDENKEKLTAEILEDLHCYNLLLSLYYRLQYGGMKCDMNMLNDCINSYKNIQYDELPKVDWELPMQIGHKLYILPEAIDYHPYPNMLFYILQKCGYGLPVAEIKNMIWNVCSAVNFRKKYTVQHADFNKKTNSWEIIKYHVKDFRDEVIQGFHSEEGIVKEKV